MLGGIPCFQGGGGCGSEACCARRSTVTVAARSQPRPSQAASFGMEMRVLCIVGVSLEFVFSNGRHLPGGAGRQNTRGAPLVPGPSCLASPQGSQPALFVSAEALQLGACSSRDGCGMACGCNTSVPAL